MFAAAPYDNPALWDFINLLIIVLGLALPLIFAGWWGHTYLHKNFASVDDMKWLKELLEEHKKAMDERSVTDAARVEKLEQEYLEVLRVLSRRKH